MFILLPSSAIFSTFLVLRTLIALSSSNWLMAWLSIEVNLLSFIPIILYRSKNQETEAAVKYFLAQALGSALILYSRISIFTTGASNLAYALLTLRLILKLGAAPCHFWFPSVIVSITWINSLILCTWQKLGPLCLLIFTAVGHSNLKSLIFLCAIISALIGGLIGINQTHTRSIIAYSSITHIGWTLGAFYSDSPSASLIYFTAYTLIIIPIFTIFAMWKLNRATQIHIIINSVANLFIFGLLMLSLSGIPPLTGFIPKWFIVLLLSSYRPVLVITLIIGSLINLYFYLRLLFSIVVASISHIHKPIPNKYNILPVTAAAASSLLGLFPIIIYAMTLLY